LRRALFYSLFLSSSSPTLKVLLFSLVSTLSLAMILSNKLTVYSKPWFFRNTYFTLFLFYVSRSLSSKSCLSWIYKKFTELFNTSIKFSCDKFFGLRLFTEFSKSIISSNSRFSRKRTFYFNFPTCVFTVSSPIWRWPHTLILFNMIYKNWYWAMDIWK
jgi:hypothetical protein